MFSNSGEFILSRGRERERRKRNSVHAQQNDEILF